VGRRLCKQQTYNGHVEKSEENTLFYADFHFLCAMQFGIAIGVVLQSPRRRLNEGRGRTLDEIEKPMKEAQIYAVSIEI
jgi:hypothetical protein